MDYYNSNIYNSNPNYSQTGGLGLYNPYMPPPVQQPAVQQTQLQPQTAPIANKPPEVNHWGNAASGALTGASAGAAAGPWGALIGGIAGGAIGYFSKEGGEMNTNLVNVEKNELRLKRAGNGFIMVDDYNDKPKHPAQGMHPEGDEVIDRGDIIIPADKRHAALTMLNNKDWNSLHELVNTLPKNGVKLEGGLNDNFFAQDAGANALPYNSPDLTTTYGAYSGDIAAHQQKMDDANLYKNLGLYGSLGTAGLGLAQMGVGFAGLANQGQMPQFSVSPELQKSYDMSLEVPKHGFTPEEYQNYVNAINQSQNATRRTALNTSGGQLSGAIKGVLQADRLQGFNTLAGQDAAQLIEQKRMQQQLMAQQAAAIQHQRNLAAQQAILQYNAKQEAYGGAAQSGMQNTGGFLNTLGSLAALSKYMKTQE